MLASKPSQNFIPIQEVRDGTVILDDGSLRMVLMTSSVNFALKSEDEQTAILSQYQNFLNSLDFPVQIFIDSRELDVDPYLKTLKEAEKEQSNELLKIQIREYVEFVKNFVSSTSIVSKSFYIIIPYSSAPGQIKGGGISSFFSRGKTNTVQKKDASFMQSKIQLQQRVAVVTGGLASTGIRAVPLNTEELIELYFKLFNPGEVDKESITERIASSK